MRSLLLCLACAALAAAQDAPAKKLIEYGWDVPYPDDVRAHIGEMERKPFDGLVFRLKEHNHAFDPRLWDAAAMQPQLDELAAIQWHSFTDNFLTLYAANNWKLDWFDDAQWVNIIANLRLTMRAVKAGRCKGICFDPEPYGPDPWLSTLVAPGRPFDQIQAMVRKRGQEWMQALQEEMPDARILSLFQLTLFTGVAQLQDPAARDRQLISHHYGLFPAFFNGWLDVIGPGIRLIDGNESSYYYTNTESYYYAYHYMKQGALPLVDPANREKYIAQARAGQALYVDQVLALRGDTPVIAKWLDKPSQLKHWEHNVYHSLRSSDEYVWLYSEKMNWWNGPVPEGLEQATASGREKAQQGKSLGFELKPLIETAQRNQREALTRRLVTREAKLQPLAGAPPKIDGELDDAAWKAALLEPLLPSGGADKAKPDAATTVWATYDAANLYLAWRCEEPFIGDLQSAGANRDDELWDGDTVELFYATGADRLPYRHFILSPKNLQWDGENAGEGDDQNWNAVWPSATKLGATAWTAEMAIPWSALGGKPAAGSKRFVNLCRARVARRELSSWSVVVAGFVEPDRFGTWVF